MSSRSLGRLQERCSICQMHDAAGKARGRPANHSLRIMVVMWIPNKTLAFERQEFSAHNGDRAPVRVSFRPGRGE